LLTADKLRTYTSKDLAQMAKKKGVQGWHSMRKDQLVRALVKLAKEKLESLLGWMKESLGDRVSEVTASERLIDSPAVVLNADRMMTSQMRKIMESLGEAGMGPATAVAFQINPRHKLTRNLYNLSQANEERAVLVLETVFDNCMMAAGLLDDPKDMVNRVYSLLEHVSKE